MIAQEDGGIELVLNHFTLHPINFALPHQALQNFAPLHYLTPSLLDFALSQVGGAKFSTFTHKQ